MDRIYIVRDHLKRQKEECLFLTSSRGQGCAVLSARKWFCPLTNQVGGRYRPKHKFFSK